MSLKTPSPGPDTHVAKKEFPRGPGVNALMPSIMPRAEDDAATRANSLEFHDRRQR